jgi:hypothetical protein
VRIYLDSAVVSICVCPGLQITSTFTDCDSLYEMIKTNNKGKDKENTKQRTHSSKNWRTDFFSYVHFFLPSSSSCVIRAVHHCILLFVSFKFTFTFSSLIGISIFLRYDFIYFFSLFNNTDFSRTEDTAIQHVSFLDNLSDCTWFLRRVRIFH